MNDNPLQQLTYIITHYGRSVIDDPRRCEALLRDLCPEQRREVNVLVSALKEGIPHDLISMNKSMPEELTLSRLRKRLYDDLGMAEDFAHWAVETWGLALGLVKQRTVLSATVKAAPAISQMADMPVPAKPVSANSQPAQGVATTGKSSSLKSIIARIFSSPAGTSPPKSRPSVQLRREPLSVSDDDFKKIFQLDDNQRPKIYIQNDYARNGTLRVTVTDRVTGLMWEQSGSKEYKTYDKAQEYIKDLNRKNFAGHSDWRLPTVEELLSLMEKKKQGDDLYIHTVFDRTQRWFWSADKRPSGGAWVVNFSNGDVVYWNRLSNSDYVRGVRS